MNRNQIESVLKINGCTGNCSDAEIRAVLLGASYSESEVDRAIDILNQQDLTQTVRSDGLHTVFYTDNALKPREISGLLGIDVDVDFDQKSVEKAPSGFSLFEVVVIVTLAAAFAVSGTLIYMYMNEIGVFHPIAMAKS